jgi:hypothetical protein
VPVIFLTNAVVAKVVLLSVDTGVGAVGEVVNAAEPATLKLAKLAEPVVETLVAVSVLNAPVEVDVAPIGVPFKLPPAITALAVLKLLTTAVLNCPVEPDTAVPEIAPPVI